MNLALKGLRQFCRSRSFVLEVDEKYFCKHYTSYLIDMKSSKSEHKKKTVLLILLMFSLNPMLDSKINDTSNIFGLF